MNDEQIATELARRVKGWKLVPEDAQAEWWQDPKNYPCFIAPCSYYQGIHSYPIDWKPLELWEDAMALAKKWLHSGPNRSFSIRAVIADGKTVWDVGLEVGDEGEWSSDWIASDQSGPRAVSLAVARAAGIEVEK